MQRVRWYGFVAVVSLAVMLALTGVRSVARAAPIFPSLTMNYTDEQGAGTLVITAMPADASAVGTPLAVTLTQNGTTLNGMGEGWSLTQDAPRQYAVALALDDGQGHDYFFSGTLTMGVDTVSGGGTWSNLQMPEDNGNWKAIRLIS